VEAPDADDFEAITFPAVRNIDEDDYLSVEDADDNVAARDDLTG
jgi:hypothetical protein